jgi:hypothetical protein
MLGGAFQVAILAHVARRSLSYCTSRGVLGGLVLYRYYHAPVVLGVFVRRKSPFLDMSGCSRRSITVPFIIIANPIAQPLSRKKHSYGKENTYIQRSERVIMYW